MRPVWVKGETVRSMEAAPLGNKRERERECVCERMRFSLGKSDKVFLCMARVGE